MTIRKAGLLGRGVTTRTLLPLCAAACVLLAAPADACEVDPAGQVACADTRLPALREAGGQARQAGQWLLSEQIFQQAVERYPAEPAVQLDLATVLVDQQKFTQAGEQLEHYQQQFGESESFWLTRGYLHDKQGEFFNSLTSYDNALRLNPRSMAAWRNKIHTVDTLGMPDKALLLAREHPDALTDEDWLRFRMDSCAYAVRMAGMEEDNRSLQQDRIHSAISLCDETLGYIRQRFPDRKQAWQQTRFDRLLVWQLDNRHQQVMDEYAALLAENAVPRDDTCIAVAQSALYLEQPAQATALLLPVTQRNPDDTNARLLLFYAYLESEQYPEAQQTIDALVRDRPAWRYGQSSNVVGENWDRVTADNGRAMLAAWGGDLDQAYADMQGYVAQAPHNTHLRTSYADIHYLRGWPRQALTLYDDVLHQAPDAYGARSGSIGAWMDLYDFRSAEQMTRHLQRDFPDLKSTETHAEDWAIHNMQELTATIGFGKSDSHSDNTGDTYSNFGSRDMEAEVFWYSRPLDYSNRLFVHTTSATGTFEEGQGQIDRYGVGWEQRIRQGDDRIRNTAELSSSIASEADPGLALTSDWGLDDHWSVYGAVETFSAHLPVRAYNDGVTAWSAEGAVTYRVDDEQHYRSSLAYVDFSDNNRRWMWNAEGYQVFYRSPHHQWAVIESLYASTNSATDVIYFSPERDSELGIAAEYQGIIQRDYDFEFRHQLLLGVGAYNQKGYGSDPVAQLDYRHIWQRDKMLSWFYGVGFHYHPYDGDSELRQSLFGGFEWRFN